MEDTRDRLRRIYDATVEARVRMQPPGYEQDERDAFIKQLTDAGAVTVLEIGSGPGNDALKLQEAGFGVSCTDLSPELVAVCRKRGLDAREMDVSDLQFPADSFDAVIAKNVLIHVAEADLERTLSGIARILKPKGLAYISTYGGSPFEGIWEGDSLPEKRFFSFRSDEQLHAYYGRHFDVESFTSVPEGFGGYHYQSFVLRGKC